MKSVVFFNNKGGVGKTTLACNVVSFLSVHKNKRVLLVDADPQCNATQIVLNEELTERIYLEEEENHKTLYTYLAPIENGEPSIDGDVIPLPGT